MRAEREPAGKRRKCGNRQKNAGSAGTRRKIQTLRLCGISPRGYEKLLLNARALLLLLLAGCATPAVDVTATQAGWQGVHYETVVAQWGVPARSTVLPDGRDARTWVSESVSGTTWFPSLSVFGGSRGAGVGVGTGVVLGQSGGVLTRCERTLFFRDGQVVEQMWQGPSDYCGTFRRH